MTDNAIVRMFFDRNGDALAELELKYGKLLKNYANRCLPDKRDSEEVYMDALNDAWTSIPPEHPKQLGAYMMTLLKRRTLNKLKYLAREKRDRNREAVFSDFDDMGSEPSAEDTALASASDLINAFLRKESSTNRVIFVKRYYYGMSTSDISFDLGITENAVSTRLHRLKERLYDYLTKEGVDLK